MRWLDRFLQRWRERLARPWIPPGARVLDVGCHRGEFLQRLGTHIAPSIGIDPLAPDGPCGPHRLVRGLFADPCPVAAGTFDVVVLLATLEHVPDKPALVRRCGQVLRPAGRVVVTVPSPRVDTILGVLRRLRLLDGMSLEEHHGFDPTTTPALFAAGGFRLRHARRFQLGLNHLYVFEKDSYISP